MFKDTKWAREIIALQEVDGKWGCFHSLSQRYLSPMTTEQALRRLSLAGYTIEDDCIQRAVSYMNDCLIGNKELPDRKEKGHDWTIFTNLILSTWIRTFTMDNAPANEIAEKWKEIIAAAFSKGEYDHEQYCKTYHHIFGLKPRGARIIDFVNFYPIALLHDCLEPKMESVFLDYIINYEGGIYYIYDSRLGKLPPVFESKNASRYLGAIELLAQYKSSMNKLQFVVEWLVHNKNENGKWDMGSSVYDKVYFPISDDWRKKGVREADCTERITKLMETLTPKNLQSQEWRSNSLLG